MLLATAMTPTDYAFYAACGLVVAYLLWKGLTDKPGVSAYE
ncbi:MAG: hypothetical protein WCX64_02295 [Candidatus Micrarchaeia archaeon]